jgi:hypothetical protein
MAEQLLEYSTGGAIAAAAYSPCGTPTGSDLLTREILKKIYNEHERILGRIIYDARCRVISQYPAIDSLYGPAVIYQTFGDPALRVKYPVLPGVAEGGRTRNEGFFYCFGKSLVIPGAAEVTVYDPSGRVAVPVFNAAAGEHVALPGGVYFVRLRKADKEIFGKAVIVK